MSARQVQLRRESVAGVGQDAVQEVRATDSATKKKSPRFTKSDHEALADIFKKIGQKELTKVSWSSDSVSYLDLGLDPDSIRSRGSGHEFAIRIRRAKVTRENRK
jgi:hypothetical protein